MSALHLHLIAVHLPVLGAPAAAALLLVARFARSEILFKTGCVCLLIATLGGGLAYFSGPSAYAFLQEGGEVQRAVVEAHAALGKGAFMGLVLLGLAALLALLQYPQGERPAPWLRWTLLLAAVALTYLLAWTAQQGGQAGHPELQANELPIFPRL